MCGISGVAGLTDVSHILLASIKSLEYRGYDSCGMAILAQRRIEIRKDVGTVDEVIQRERLYELHGLLGIAHTRWATHGGVTSVNAHPHLSNDGAFAVVHNGIISNYRQLRGELVDLGYVFSSETDSEVIPHLLHFYYRREQDVEGALRCCLTRLEGSYAFALLTTHEPERLYCAKLRSPLILGIGSKQNFIGSDFNAFIAYTRSAVVLDDHEYAVLTNDSYRIINALTGVPSRKVLMHIAWDPEQAQKGGYPHYMLKEVFEQPQTVSKVLAIERGDLEKLARSLFDAGRPYLIGAGTTYYAALFGQYQLAELARLFVPAISSDEFKYGALVDAETLVVAISQSGETYDTLEALRHAREHGAHTAAIVNVQGSSMTRLVDQVIMQGSGPEICVVSTKSALAQMLILTRLALVGGLLRGALNEARYDELEAELGLLPAVIQRILNEKAGFINMIARRHCHVNDWLYLGRGIYYAVAMESALKMKEVAYLHAEGMPGGFLKHGTLALIGEGINTIVFMPPKAQRELHDLSLGSSEEVKARGGYLIGIHFDAEPSLYQDQVQLPEMPSILGPFAQLVIGQLLAYFAATALKRNVDKPRSLAKSVTVA